MYNYNPAGYGPGVYIGPQIEGNERLIRIVFQWLSRTGAVKALTREESLPVYQVLHMFTMFGLLKLGKARVEEECGRRGISSAGVPHSNYTYSTQYNTYWVWFEPDEDWIELKGTTPPRLRALANSLRSDPRFQSYVDQFARALSGEDDGPPPPPPYAPHGARMRATAEGGGASSFSASSGQATPRAVGEYLLRVKYGDKSPHAAAVGIAVYSLAHTNNGNVLRTSRSGGTRTHEVSFTSPDAAKRFARALMNDQHVQLTDNFGVELISRQQAAT